MDEQLELHGTIDRIIYQQPDTGFCVFILTLNKTQSTTVSGNLSSIHAGEQITLRGSWVMHPKFGKQFNALSCVKQVPTSIIGLKKYLSSGLIKGIGPVYAERLVNAFGEQVLEIIDKEPEKLKRVPGIGGARVTTIIKAWQDQKEISHVMVFLQEKGISPAYAAKIYKQYGQESIALITENPYRLAEDIWGVGFKTADTIAQKIGIIPQSIARIKAAILHMMSDATSSGDLYQELGALKESVINLLTLDTTADSLLKTALHDLYNEMKIKLITHENRIRCTKICTCLFKSIWCAYYS